jgi:hypothetical protein
MLTTILIGVGAFVVACIVMNMIFMIIGFIFG